MFREVRCDFIESGENGKYTERNQVGMYKAIFKYFQFRVQSFSSSRGHGGLGESWSSGECWRCGGSVRFSRFGRSVSFWKSGQ